MVKKIFLEHVDVHEFHKLLTCDVHEFHKFSTCDISFALFFNPTMRLSILNVGTTGDSFIRVEKRIEPAKITIFNLSYLSFYFMYQIAIKSIKKISYLFSLSIIFINIAHF